MSKPLTIDLIGDTEIRVTRHFNATPEPMYRAHTDPALIQKFCLGHDGWTMAVCISEARAGGHFR